jgi:hypothetical protein
MEARRLKILTTFIFQPFINKKLTQRSFRKLPLSIIATNDNLKSKYQYDQSKIVNKNTQKN